MRFVYGVRFSHDTFISVGEYLHDSITFRFIVSQFFDVVLLRLLCWVFFPGQVDEGKHVEDKLNKAGPGLCLFVSCDVSKEEDIKVRFKLRSCNVV